jgi:hypothetical protein
MIDARCAEGCLTVEMEAASLLAVAQFRKVLLGQILYAGVPHARHVAYLRPLAQLSAGVEHRMRPADFHQRTFTRLAQTNLVSLSLIRCMAMLMPGVNLGQFQIHSTFTGQGKDTLLLFPRSSRPCAFTLAKPPG